MIQSPDADGLAHFSHARTGELDKHKLQSGVSLFSSRSLFIPASMSEATKAEWETLAAAKRAARDGLIPKDTLLKNPPGADVLDVRDVPRCSGILSAEELEITEPASVTALVEAIASKKYTSEQVVRAFCRRAAIAQQVVSVLHLPRPTTSHGSAFQSYLFSLLSRPI